MRAHQAASIKGQLQRYNFVEGRRIKIRATKAELTLLSEHDRQVVIAQLELIWRQHFHNARLHSTFRYCLQQSSVTIIVSLQAQRKWNGQVTSKSMLWWQNAVASNLMDATSSLSSYTAAQQA